MKILFTAGGEGWNSPMDPRLGRADFLLLYDEESGEITANSNQEAATVPHAGLFTAEKIMELRPDVVITGNGPGRKAYDILEGSDIIIYTGAGGMSVQEAYDAFKAGRLERF